MNKFQEFVTNIWQNENGYGIGRPMNWRQGDDSELNSGNGIKLYDVQSPEM